MRTMAPAGAADGEAAGSGGLGGGGGERRDWGRSTTG